MIEEKTAGPEPASPLLGKASEFAKAAAAPAMGLGAMCSREKYWEEKTDAEKIEMLGQVCEALSGLVADQDSQIDILRQHRHGVQGELTAPIDATHPRYPKPPYYGRPVDPLRRRPR